MVLARGADRQRLMHYLRTRTSGGAPRLSLTSCPVRDAIVNIGSGLMHIDDEVIELDRGTPVTVSVEPGAVQVLQGPVRE